MTQMPSPGTHFLHNDDAYLVVNPAGLGHQVEAPQFHAISLTTGCLKTFDIGQLSPDLTIDTIFNEDEVSPLEYVTAHDTSKHIEQYEHGMNRLIAQYKALQNALYDDSDSSENKRHRNVVIGLDQFLYIASHLQELEEAAFNLVDKIRPTLHPDFDECEGNAYEFMLDAVHNAAETLGGQLQWSETEGLAGAMERPMIRLFRPEYPHEFIAADEENDIPTTQAVPIK